MASVLSARFAEIGLILLAGSIFAYYVARSTIAPMYSYLFFSTSLNELESLAMLDAPSIVLALLGLLLYVAGRGKFWKNVEENRTARILTPVLGGLVSGFGVFFFLIVYVSAGYAAKLAPFGITFNDVLIDYSTSLIGSALWFISGIPVMIDSWKNLSDKTCGADYYFSTHLLYMRTPIA